MPLLAQAVPGDWLVFVLSDGASAELAIRKQEGELARLKAGIRTYGHLTKEE
jgi:hypothetical protein